MRIVTIKDSNDYSHSYLVQNLSQPFEEGIELSIPDLSKINWVVKRKELHNMLHDAQLFTAQDVSTNDGYKKLAFIISKIYFEELYKLYREVLPKK